MGISAFETDIFISYHHSDNGSLAGGEGWVSDFHSRLHVRLCQLTGIDPSIWRDERLGAADVFPQEIRSRLAKTALVLAVVSPGYLLSSWCDREIKEFQSAAGGLQAGNKSRVIKVVKTPADGDRHRNFLNSSLGAEFYLRNSETGLFREFKPGSAEYDNTFELLAQEIARLLPGIKSKPASTTIYVADTTGELREHRARLCQEFEDRGCVILPDSALSADADSATLTKQIEEALARSMLSVHVFGSRYGAIPDGAECSVPALQYQLALGASKPLVVWTVPGEKATGKQGDFLTQVCGAVAPQQELLDRKTIEDLKDVVLERIARAEKKAAAPPPPDAEDRPQVYLVCDRADHPALAASGEAPRQSEQLKQFLASQGFVVWLPMADETDAARLREDHKQTLQVCNAVVVYWGKASHGWFREKLRELVQAKGWGTRRSFMKALYIAAPESPERKTYDGYEQFVFMQFEGFTPAPLNPFIQRVSAASREDGA